MASKDKKTVSSASAAGGIRTSPDSDNAPQEYYTGGEKSCGSSMEVYLFFHEVNWGMGFDRLYKLKLPSLPMSPSLTVDTEEFSSPILEIPRKKYPNLMGCVHLNSKLYFFGGYLKRPLVVRRKYSNSYPYDDCFEDETHKLYSRKFYVFDLNAGDDNHQGLIQLPSMATGKPTPCGFVANGMVYVLGGSVMSSCRLSDDFIKRFERFNPVDRKWQVLDDSPLRCLDECMEGIVIENQHKVLITGMKGRETIYLVYDFLHDKWDSDCLPAHPSPHIFSHIAGSDNNNNGGGHYLYGIGSCRPCAFPFKLGPLKDLDYIHELSLVDISFVDTPKEFVRKAISRRIATHMNTVMWHLGNGHFCYVHCGQICFANGGDGHSPPRCKHTRRVSVTIFKELSSPVAIQEEGKGQASSFEAQILCVKDFYKNMKCHGGLDLAGWFSICRDSTLKVPLESGDQREHHAC